MGAEIRGGRSSRWAIDSDKPDQIAFSSLRDEEPREIEQNLEAVALGRLKLILVDVDADHRQSAPGTSSRTVRAGCPATT